MSGHNILGVEYDLAVTQERGEHLHMGVETAPRYIRRKEKQDQEQHMLYAVLYFLIQGLVLSAGIPKKMVNTGAFQKRTQRRGASVTGGWGTLR